MEKQHQEGRKVLATKMPDLAVRVFALDDASYPGCGFHSMIKTLGLLLQKLNDYDNPFTVDDMISCDVVYEELEQSVSNAEMSQAA